MNKITFQRLLALVNRALWSKPVNEELFTGMDKHSWATLYELSVRQGVMSVAFDGLQHLPPHLQPPSKLRITWAISTAQVERKYNHILHTATSLGHLLKERGINMLLFKGLNLSQLYPIPAHREFGDIDIYLFGKHKEGDLLLDEVAVKKEESNHYKHSNYYYRDIMIENHAFLLNVHDSNKIARLNQTLLDMLGSEEVIQPSQEVPFLFPSPNFTALFFIIHATKHLTDAPLPLRTYCDWALFLQAYKDKIDADKWKDYLRQAEMLPVAEALTALTFKWMDGAGTPPFTTGSHPELEEVITRETLYPSYTSCKGKMPWTVFRYKYNRFCNNCKRHTYFYGGSFYRHYFSFFAHSFIHHLRHPETIFKTQ